MADVLLGDAPVVETVAHASRTGAWWADLILAPSTAPDLGAQLTMTLLGTAYLGTVQRVRTYVDRVTVRLVAGSAGLSKQAGPLAYQGTPLVTPWLDVLAAVGETSDPTSDTAALGAALVQRWYTLQAPAGTLLDVLADQVGRLRLPPDDDNPYVWRVLPAGGVWLGREDWQEYAGSVVSLAAFPQEARELVSCERGDLLPGLTYQGRQISRVQVEVCPDSVRQTLWYEG